jgi:hypothetical protein
MGRQIRTVTDEQCRWFADDLAALDMDLARLLSRHKCLAESVWLGGKKDEDNTEEGPETLVKAISLIRGARALIAEADHLNALFRVHNTL